MLKRVLGYMIALIIVVPTFALAFASKQAIAPKEPTTAKTNFIPGKDYEVISESFAPPIPGAAIKVAEFFNYGCPACNHFEPELEKWLNKKPANVGFERVPVVFEPGWDILAKAYFVANTLGVEKQLTPAIFAAIHQKGINLADPATLEQFFIGHGVSKADFESAINFSPGIDAQLLRSDNLMRTYKVVVIPTVVINGRYKVNPSLAGNSERMLAIIDYLIAKEKARAAEGAKVAN